jgi:mRNA interferase RelE/StbE
MTAWQPRIAPSVAEIIAHLPPAVKHDIRAAVRLLSVDPHVGEPLQRELRGLWKYRVRSFRVVYRLIPEQHVLQIVAVGHRRTIYDIVRQSRQG